MSLTFVTPAPPEERHRKIVLYGHTNSGKSTGALKAPGPILYLNAEGEDALETPRSLVPTADVREFVIAGEQSLNDVVVFLKDGGDGVRTVVLDSLSETYRVVLRAYQKGSQAQVQEYGHVSSMLEGWLRAIRDLPFHIVVICHVLTVEDQGALMLHPHAGTNKETAIVRYLEHVFANVIGYCTFHDDEYVAQVVPGNGRIGKDRTNTLGKTQPLDVGAWIKTINTAAVKAAKKETKA